MKKKIIMTILIIFVLSLLVGVSNKSFFKNYYETTNLKGEKIKIPLPLFSYYQVEQDGSIVTFKTFRGVNNIQNILNNYVEYLQSCYDESYFYDSNLDITINRYYIEKGVPFNNIYLDFDYGNYCENEFVLDNNWLIEFIEKAEVQEVVINNCI